MENQDNLTPDTLPGGTHVEPSGGQEAVADTLSLAELNQYLGKDFKDKATALKAVKDTFSFVGKKQETTASATVSPELEAQVQSLKEEVFYSQHPEYSEYRSIIKKMGGNPSEVVGTDEFKLLFEKVKVADDVQKKQSVVSSNSRVAAPSTYRQEAVTIANAAGTTGEDLAGYFAKQINESLGQ